MSRSRGKASLSGATSRDLPVLGARDTSRWSRRRALVLLGVHALIAIHVAHFMVAGRTLSPVEPSEAMYSLELGLVNAGFVFFLLAILSTLVLGRFFCGWGCHVVALQDLCAHLMRKARIKPQPFRSRLLVLAPLALALYMFAWPTFRRVVLGEGPPFPGFSNHLVTSDFWRTFPGPVFAILTFATCGFLAVVVLGSKGYCTYGCPYGAFFSIADRFAPVRIVANGCQQAGQCTPACTSNVLVHQEVRTHAMVVDPGCMKCMDCVAACPNEALSVGLARPSLLVGKAAASRAPAGWLSWKEEILAGAVMLLATLAFRGLYDGPPLLMAIGLGAITAFVALQLARLPFVPTVRIQSATLRAGGELTRAGRIFAAVAAAWLAFTAHSGFVQWHRIMGREALQHTEVGRQAALSGAFDPGALGPAHERALASAARHFGLADRWGLVPVSEVELGLAWCHLLRQEPGPAEARIRKALDLDRSDAVRHENLVELLLAQGRLPEAERALAGKLAEASASPAAAARDHVRRGEILVVLGRSEEALDEFRAAVAQAPGLHAARHDLGGLLRRLGRTDEAVAQLREAARLGPDDPETLAELALALAAAGESAGAVEAARRAVEAAPANPAALAAWAAVSGRSGADSGASPAVP